MRRSVLIATILLGLAFVLIGGPSLLYSPTTSEVAPETEYDPEPELVRPTGGESGFWPYLNSRRSFEKRSSINVVILGETDEVVRALTEARDRDWQETDEEQAEAEPGSFAGVEGNETAVTETPTNEPPATETAAPRTVTTGTPAAETPATETVTNKSPEDGLVVGSTVIQWGRTTGASRYAYVDPGPEAEGQWVAETAQIHDGSYYGYRYHIRLYESPHPDERWVAMQTHSEHFDWFTLRHRIAGSQHAQTRLEADLMGLPQIDVQEDVRRVYLANGNASDADGWATFVNLVGMVTAGAAVGLSMAIGPFGRSTTVIESILSEADRRRLDMAVERVESHQLVLVATIIAVVLGVRIAGIALEGTAEVSMHTIAALLYPFIAIGLPGATYAIARGLERRLDAAVTASGSLAVAIWLDYGFLGVHALPIDVIVQRMLVVVALGLIAGGAARRATRTIGWNDMLIGGVLLWVLVLGGTMFGYL